MKMNELAMRKTENDIEYNPYKIIGKYNKDVADTNKAEIETELKKQELRRS